MKDWEILIKVEIAGIWFKLSIYYIYESQYL